MAAVTEVEYRCRSCGVRWAVLRRGGGRTVAVYREPGTGGPRWASAELRDGWWLPAEADPPPPGWAGGLYVGPPPPDGLPDARAWVDGRCRCGDHRLMPDGSTHDAGAVARRGKVVSQPVDSRTAPV